MHYKEEVSSSRIDQDTFSSRLLQFSHGQITYVFFLLFLPFFLTFWDRLPLCLGPA